MEFILGSSIFLLVITLFILLYVVSERKHPSEKGLTPIYSERCGGNYGIVQASFPFVRLTLYEDFMILRSYSTLIVEYARIKELRDAGFLNTGVEIVTTNPSKYGQPTIGSFDIGRVKMLIKEQVHKHKAQERKHPAARR